MNLIFFLTNIYSQLLNFFKWLFDIFSNPSSHEIQSLLWSVVGSLFIVFLVEYLRRPKIKFEKELVIHDTNWKRGKLWKLKILLKQNFLSRIFFGYSINNLKLFYTVYNEQHSMLVKLQALSDDGPNPWESSKFECKKGINLARGENSAFHLIIRSNNTESYRGTGKTPIPEDYWYIPCYESLTDFKHEGDSSEPSNDNVYVLRDGTYFFKILILSDQLIKQKWLKLELKDNKAILSGRGFFERFFPLEKRDWSRAPNDDEASGLIKQNLPANKSKKIIKFLLLLSLICFLLLFVKYIEILFFNLDTLLLLFPFIILFVVVIIKRWKNLINSEGLLTLFTVLITILFFFFDYANKQKSVIQLIDTARDINCQAAETISKTPEASMPQTRYVTDILVNNADAALKWRSTHDKNATDTLANIIWGMEQSNNVIDYMYNLDLTIVPLEKQNAKQLELTKSLNAIKEAAKNVKEIFKCTTPIDEQI